MVLSSKVPSKWHSSGTWRAADELGGGPDTTPSGELLALQASFAILKPLLLSFRGQARKGGWRRGLRQGEFPLSATKRSANKAGREMQQPASELVCRKRGVISTTRARAAGRLPAEQTENRAETLSIGVLPRKNPSHASQSCFLDVSGDRFAFSIAKSSLLYPWKPQERYFWLNPPQRFVFFLDFISFVLLGRLLEHYSGGQGHGYMTSAFSFPNVRIILHNLREEQGYPHHLLHASTREFLLGK